MPLLKVSQLTCFENHCLSTCEHIPAYDISPGSSLAKLPVPVGLDFSECLCVGMLSCFPVCLRSHF